MNADITRLERQNRILKAMRGEKNDRVPLMFAGDYALIRYAKPETTFGYMIREHETMTQTIIDDVLPKFPKVDMLAAVGMSSKHLGAAHMAKTYLPGKELDEDVMWQLLFEHIMKEEDYDFVIKNGWKKYQDICLFERLGYDPEEMRLDFEAGLRNKQRYYDAGYPFIKGSMLPAPFDALAFGRGLMDFFCELYEIPEKILAVLNIIMDEYEAENEAEIRRSIAEAKAHGEEIMYTIAPCVQANCNLLGRDMFEQFGWPLIERQANFILDAGGYIFFHMDANWTDFLDLFKAFPKGRCLFDSDGGTDMRRLKDTLGGRMALTGSIAPALLAFGTPEKVYKACCDEIEEMGDGYILAGSCTLPANMPGENVDAMYAAIS